MLLVGRKTAESSVLTWGLSEQSGPADVGQQVIDVGGGLHILCVHRRLDGQTKDTKHSITQQKDGIYFHKAVYFP